MLVTKYGMAIRFNETDVRITGRQSIGVIGMNLDDGDEVVAMQLTAQGEYLLTVSEKGLGKLTPISEFNSQHRGGKGVKCYRIMEKSGNLVGAKIIDQAGQIIIMTTSGIMIRLEMTDIRIIGRNTTGVKLMNIDADSDVRVARFARVRETEEDAETNVANAGEKASDNVIPEGEDFEDDDYDDPDKAILHESEDEEGGDATDDE